MSLSSSASLSASEPEPEADSSELPLSSSSSAVGATASGLGKGGGSGPPGSVARTGARVAKNWAYRQGLARGAKQGQEKKEGYRERTEVH